MVFPTQTNFSLKHCDNSARTNAALKCSQEAANFLQQQQSTKYSKNLNVDLFEDIFLQSGHEFVICLV